MHLYHNPRCSKSRQALELLRAQGVEPEIVDYLKAPPTVEQLRALLSKLGLEPRQIMRRDEPEYRELGLDRPELDDEALIQALADHPRLLQRPIAVSGEAAVLGRPPEKVLELLKP